MSIWFRTWWDRSWALFLSLLHPYTIARTVQAFLIGFTRLYAKHRDYVNGHDKKELREKNPTGHETMCKYRRRWRTLWLVSDFALLLICIFFFPHIPIRGHEKNFGPILFLLAHSALLIYMGRDRPIVKQVETGRMNSEGLILTVTNEMTLSSADIKEGLTAEIEKPPTALKYTKGYECVVRVHRKGNPLNLIDDVPRLAHKLHKGNGMVFTDQYPTDSSIVRYAVLEADPWKSPPTECALAKNPKRISIWETRCDLGIHPDRTPWLMRLVAEGDGGGQVAGGAPRMGKTTYLKVLITYLLLDPMNDVNILDGKGLDFDGVRNACKTFVGAADDEEEMDDYELLIAATKLFEELKKEMARRKRILRARGVSNLTKKLSEELNLPLIWNIIDEISVITEDLMSGKHKQEALYFLDILKNVIRMGPALGIFCILATQRPSDKSLPDALRSMIIFRICFKVGSDTASRAVLGKAGPAYRADKLPKGDIDKGIGSGVGIATEYGQVRPHFVTREDLERVAAYAIALRAGDIIEVPEEQEFDYPPIVKTVISIMEDEGVERMPTSDLLIYLFDRGKKYTYQALAKEMKTYGVSSTKWSADGRTGIRGYSLDDVKRAPRIVPIGVFDSPSAAIVAPLDALPPAAASTDREDETNG